MGRELGHIRNYDATPQKRPYWEKWRRFLTDGGSKTEQTLNTSIKSYIIYKFVYQSTLPDELRRPLYEALRKVYPEND